MKNRYNEIYEVLMKSISQQIKKTLFEYEEFINSEDDFILKVYDKKNVSDNDYITKNRKEIWDFFDTGYKFAKLGGFKNSCSDYRSLNKNYSKIKLVYKDDVLIAASIYSGHQQGNKCVEITATTNIEYRELSKEAIKYIIKQDIGLYKDFYWGTFDGAIEHYYEKFGGILIPNDYAHLFLRNGIIIDPDSEYKINLNLRDGTEVSKVIYGFNSKETYDKIIAEDDIRIKKQIEHMQTFLNKNNTLHEKVDTIITLQQYHVDVINLFYEERLDGRSTLTPYMVSLINNSKKFLENFIIKNPNIENKDYYELAIWNAQDILDTSTVTKLHKF